MQCPLCVDESLDPRIRGGVEIDVCPRCRGVWLDRGEIDKLSGPAVKSAPVKDRGRSERKERDDDYKRKSSKKKRKKSFGSRLADVLEEIID